MAIQPMIFGHQLLGDSHMVKLAMMVGGHSGFISPEAIGLCISGQSILGLTRRLQNTSIIYEKVLLMIGNNDYQRNVDKETIQKHFMDLVEHLLSRVRTLVILTVVPSPELINGKVYRLRSVGFNKWLFSVNWWETMQVDPGRMVIVDVTSQFVNLHEGIRKEFFEPLNRFTVNQPDGLCLNDYGMKIIMDILARNSHPL